MRIIFLIFSTGLLFFGNILSISSEFEDENGPIGVDVGNIINDTLASILGNVSDPLLIANFSETFNNAIISGPVSIFDFKISGIPNIVASVLSLDYRVISSSTVNVTLNIPNLNLFLDYDFNVLLLQILPFFGKGNISLNLDEISIEFFTLVDIKISPVSISGFKDLSLEFYIGKGTSLSIEGLLYSDDLSKQLNQIIAEFGGRIIDFLDVNKDRVGKLISSILQSILDGLDKNDYYNDIFADILEKAAVYNN